MARSPRAIPSLHPSSASIIDAIKTPLGFFALVALIIEIILGVVATRVEGYALAILVTGMVTALLLLIVVVYLLGDDSQAANYSITLGPPQEMRALNLRQISWDASQCFVLFSNKKEAIKPVPGPGGYEVRLSRAIMKKLSDTEPIELTLVDRKGLRWEVQPFYINRTEVSLSSLENAERIVASYGGVDG